MAFAGKGAPVRCLEVRVVASACLLITVFPLHYLPEHSDLDLLLNYFN